jgi:hypothetical protein
MEHPKRLLTKDDIKENIIAADKRKTISKATISKYVSSLRNSLQLHFQHDLNRDLYLIGYYLRLQEGFFGVKKPQGLNEYGVLLVWVDEAFQLT